MREMWVVKNWNALLTVFAACLSAGVAWLVFSADDQRYSYQINDIQYRLSFQDGDDLSLLVDREGVLGPEKIQVSAIFQDIVTGDAIRGEWVDVRLPTARSTDGQTVYTISSVAQDICNQNVQTVNCDGKRIEVVWVRYKMAGQERDVSIAFPNT